MMQPDLLAPSEASRTCGHCVVRNAIREGDELRPSFVWRFPSPARLRDHLATLRDAAVKAGGRALKSERTRVAAHGSGRPRRSAR